MEYNKKEMATKHQAELDNVQLQSAAQARQLEDEIADIISSFDPNLMKVLHVLYCVVEHQKTTNKNAPASPLPRVAQIRPKTAPNDAAPAQQQNALTPNSQREQERKKCLCK